MTVNEKKVYPVEKNQSLERYQFIKKGELKFIPEKLNRFYNYAIYDVLLQYEILPKVIFCWRFLD